jgi:hypothetical protein
MLAMYLKYHKAGLIPTTPVISTAISAVKMSIGCKSLINLRSEMIFLQGKRVFLYLPTIYTPILTANLPILLAMDTSVTAKWKVGQVTSSAFRSFSGFIIALRNKYEKFIFWRLVINSNNTAPSIGTIAG